MDATLSVLWERREARRAFLKLLAPIANLQPRAAAPKSLGPEKGTSLILHDARATGAAKREFQAQTRCRPLHPRFRPQGTTPLHARSYFLHLFIVQPTIDPCNPVPRALQGPPTQGGPIAAVRTPPQPAPAPLARASARPCVLLRRPR